MGERWYQEKKREGFYRMAKREGYRARSAYKLLQIQEKFNVVKKGDVVIDLGSAPGGWSQVATELVGPTGVVLAVDLANMKALEGVTFIRGDFTKPETRDAVAKELAKAPRPAANIVLSDMSPDISGNYMRDQAESAFLSGLALDFAQHALDRGGNFIVKIFEGSDYPEFLARLKELFEFVKPYRPIATRKSSSEVYVVAKGYRGPPTKP